MTPARRSADLAVSVRARLRNLSRERHEEFQLVLSAFAVERLLYRLGRSSLAGRFVVKGATLLRLWSPADHRATWDLDLLGRGGGAGAGVGAAARHLCQIDAGDGVVFDAASISGEEIRAADEYAGVRVRLEARLAGARIPVQVDVAFGDVVFPAPEVIEFPTLLDQPAPRVQVYPREAVVAEKLEVICSLGVTTSRMKDYYDLHVLAESFEFAGPSLTEAVRATFGRRRTPFPAGEPSALTGPFLTAAERAVQWRAFLRRSRLRGPVGAAELVDLLRGFLLPVLRAASQGEPFDMAWRPGGPWRPATQARAGEKGNG